MDKLNCTTHSSRWPCVEWFSFLVPRAIEPLSTQCNVSAGNAPAHDEAWHGGLAGLAVAVGARGKALDPLRHRLAETTTKNRENKKAVSTRSEAANIAESQKNNQ